MENYTPGKFLANDGMIVSDVGIIVGQTYSRQHLSVKEKCKEMVANAQLFAAAKDMLVALQKVQQYLGRSGEDYLLDSFGVNQAIIKATKGDNNVH